MSIPQWLFFLLLVLPAAGFFLGSRFAATPALRCPSSGDGVYCTDPVPPVSPDGGVACPLDAKMCPDGSGVGRTGPNCEFAPCPTAPPSDLPQAYCTQDVKSCSDGSYVSRRPPTCDFSPCPGETPAKISCGEVDNYACPGGMRCILENSYPDAGGVCVPEEMKKGSFCGGIAALQCPRGMTCVLDGDYPDAGGTCQP